VWFASATTAASTAIRRSPADSEVRELFQRPSLRDKGFGPAPGQRPGESPSGYLPLAGLRHPLLGQRTGMLDRGEHALQFALLDGWYGRRAGQSPPHRTCALSGGRARRGAHVHWPAAPKLTVGHVDMIGYPA